MILLLCLLFFGLGLFSILPLKIDKNYKYFFVSIGILFFIIVAFRGQGVDRDYQNYIKFFDDYKKLSLLRVEPSFIFFAWLVKNVFFNEVVFIFFLYALIGISVKLYAIKELSHFWLLSLVIYVSYSFTLHDMTQIRVGGSVAFILLSIKPLYERKLFLFLILALLACSFHYSAIFVFFLWFLNPNKINGFIWGGLLILSFVLALLHIYATVLVGFIPIKAIFNKFLAYLTQEGGEMNILNSWQLLRCFLSFLLLWKVNVIQKHNKYAILTIKIYVLSASIYFLLSNIAVLIHQVELTAGCSLEGILVRVLL